MNRVASPPAIARILAVPDGEANRFRGLRRSAIEWVSEHGFPTAKDEAWRHMPLASILKVPFARAERYTSRRSSPTIVADLAGDLGGARLVFVNGYFVAELSSVRELPSGARLANLASLPATDGPWVESVLARQFREEPDAFTALNAAFSEDGGFLALDRHTVVEEPIHFVFLSDPGAEPLVSHPRSLVLAGAGSRATIVETHAALAGGVYLSNSVTELLLEEEACIEHYKVQNEAETAYSLSLLRVRQDQSSRFFAHSVALGSSTARCEIKARLEAPKARIALHGLYLPHGKQHLENSTTIEHSAPDCSSRELYKGAVDDRGRGAFDGRIIVHRGAAGTDASQTSKSLLMSASAQADSRPRLEIFADDVKCSHGAAVGQLDQNAIFYLRSRGLSEKAARTLLTYAFVREMVDLIRVPSLRSRVEGLVAERLERGSQERAA